MVGLIFALLVWFFSDTTSVGMSLMHVMDAMQLYYAVLIGLVVVITLGTVMLLIFLGGLVGFFMNYSNTALWSTKMITAIISKYALQLCLIYWFQSGLEAQIQSLLDLDIHNLILLCVMVLIACLPPSKIFGK
jgi:hypothetical protein